MFSNRTPALSIFLIALSMCSAKLNAQMADAEDFDPCETVAGPPEPATFSEDGRSWRMRATGEAKCYTCTKTTVIDAKRIATLRAKENLLQGRASLVKGAMKAKDGLGCQEESGQVESQACKSISGYSLVSQDSWEGMLRGVVTLGECTDPENKVVRVTLGLSSKSMDLAAEVDDRTTNPPGSNRGASRSPPGSTQPSSPNERATEKRKRTTTNTRDF